MKTTTKIAITIPLIIIAALAGYILYQNFTSPPEDEPTPTPVNTYTPDESLSKVEVSATNITVGDDLTLSTTVSDRLQGLTVYFYDSENGYIDSDETDINGYASITITAQDAGKYTFYAKAVHP